MQKKPNIRSIRYSDEIADMIDRQAGENFSHKFENLVTRAFYELPAAEKELARVNGEIEQRRKELQKLRSQYSRLSAAARDIQVRLDGLSRAIPKDV